MLSKRAYHIEKLMIFISLPHRNSVLEGLVATNKIVFRGLPHGIWFLEVRHAEKGF